MGCTHAPGAWGQLACNVSMGLRMKCPLSCMAKRVDVSMGCQGCESHKYVMAAVAEMRPGQSLGNTNIKWWVNWMPIRVLCGPCLLATEIQLVALRFLNSAHVIVITWIGMCAAQYHGSHRLQLRRAVVGCSCGLQLAAVAACSWHEVASSDARGMNGHAVAACSCVLRRARIEVTLASWQIALAFLITWLWMCATQ